MANCHIAMDRSSSALILLSNIKRGDVHGFSKKLSKESNHGGIPIDHHKIASFLQENRKIPIFETVLGQRYVRQTKHDIMELLERFIFQDSISRFVIYYSGHGGEGTYGTNYGDWCFEENVATGTSIRISLQDILTVWDNMRAKFNSDSFSYEKRDLLFIIADCCHSGGWVNELRSRPCKYDPDGRRYRDVHMIASCGKDEECSESKKGGTFTDHFINSDSSTHNLNDTAEHIAKLSAQSIFQALTFPLYMPIKGMANLYNANFKYDFTPVATNDESEYRVLLMKHDGIKLPIGRGLGLNSGWSWMLSGQVFHN